jgi:hypothetical protein
VGVFLLAHDNPADQKCQQKNSFFYFFFNPSSQSKYGRQWGNGRRAWGVYPVRKHDTAPFAGVCGHFYLYRMEEAVFPEG